MHAVTVKGADGSEASLDWTESESTDDVSATVGSFGLLQALWDKVYTHRWKMYGKELVL